MHSEPSWVKNVKSWDAMIVAIGKNNLSPYESVALMTRVAPTTEIAAFLDSISKNLGDRYWQYLKLRVATLRDPLRDSGVGQSDEFKYGVESLRRHWGDDDLRRTLAEAKVGVRVPSPERIEELKKYLLA